MQLSASRGSSEGAADGVELDGVEAGDGPALVVVCDPTCVVFRSFSDIEGVIRSAWSAESCDPVDLEHWSPQNPARGQCAPTALIVQEFVGGDLLLADVCNDDGSRQGVHFWNRMAGGLEVDLTREQFLPTEVVQHPKVVERAADLTGGRLYPQYVALAAAVRAGLEAANDSGS